jgi:hypothetical protein
MRAVVVVAAVMIATPALAQSANKDFREFKETFIDNLATATLMQQHCDQFQVNTEKVEVISRVLKMRQDDMLPGGRDWKLLKKHVDEVNDATSKWEPEVWCMMADGMFGSHGTVSRGFLIPKSK